MDVPEERLELSRDNSQRLLRPQRLPISPSGLGALKANSDCYRNHDKRSAQKEIRTPTPLRAPAPQAGASTNFATWAFQLVVEGRQK